MRLLQLNKIVYLLIFLNLLLLSLIGCTTAPRYTRPSVNHQPKYISEEKIIKAAESVQNKQIENKDTISPSEVLSKTDTVTQKTDEIEQEPIFTETGLATFYSDNLQNHRTAYGEKYDKNQYTAAHKTLPYNTMVKVTSLDNQKSIIVRINDRGPSGANKIIDLSKIAANEIDLVRKGLTKVQIEVFEYPNQ